MDQNEAAGDSFIPFPHFATLAIHAGQEPEQWGSRAVVPPISLATTFKQDEPGKHSVFIFIIIHEACAEDSNIIFRLPTLSELFSLSYLFTKLFLIRQLSLSSFQSR